MDNTQVTQIATMTTELAETEYSNFIQDLTQPRRISYCSMIPKNHEEKVKLFNAMNNPSGRVSELINKKIKLKDVFAEIVPLVNTDSGEIQQATRIVLIDEKNTGYACVSKVIYSALSKLFTIAGTPDQWDKPMDIEIKQITKNVGNQVRNLLTFDLV